MEYRKFNNVLSRNNSYAEFKEVYDEVRGASTKNQIANYCFSKEVIDDEGMVASGTSLLTLYQCGELAAGEKVLVFVGFSLEFREELTAVPNAVIVSIDEETETVSFFELPDEEVC